VERFKDVEASGSWRVLSGGAVRAAFVPSISPPERLIPKGTGTHPLD
jgi:hypothetical protein